jgi:hypothetical protein
METNNFPEDMKRADQVFSEWFQECYESKEGLIYSDSDIEIAFLDGMREERERIISMCDRGAKNADWLRHQNCNRHGNPRLEGRAKAYKAVIQWIRKLR